MSISKKDIKMLWGRAAGRCSFPGCGARCISAGKPFVIGQMAHVIGKRPTAKRGIPSGGKNSYDNLILLCPTHHTIIDKSPEENFTTNILLKWKQKHEKNIEDTLASPSFETIEEIAKYIKTLLIENTMTWKSYGPESEHAVTNPLSNLARLWTLRKLDTIIPNNRRIIAAIQRNKCLFDNESYALACSFIEHAEGFETNCYSRLEGVPRFPKQFETMVKNYADI